MQEQSLKLRSNPEWNNIPQFIVYDGRKLEFQYIIDSTTIEFSYRNEFDTINVLEMKYPNIFNYDFYNDSMTTALLKNYIELINITVKKSPRFNFVHGEVTVANKEIKEKTKEEVSMNIDMILNMLKEAGLMPEDYTNESVEKKDMTPKEVKTPIMDLEKINKGLDEIRRNIDQFPDDNIEFMGVNYELDIIRSKNNVTFAYIDKDGLCLITKTYSNDIEPLEMGRLFKKATVDFINLHLVEDKTEVPTYCDESDKAVQELYDNFMSDMTKLVKTYDLANLLFDGNTTNEKIAIYLEESVIALDNLIN